MSKFLRLRVGFFLSAFLVAPGLMFAQGSIEGRVVNRVTGDGVAKAQVKVYAGRDLRYQAVTEPDGSFWISMRRREATPSLHPRKALRGRC
jgi:hypothetical protein